MSYQPKRSPQNSCFTEAHRFQSASKRTISDPSSTNSQTNKKMNLKEAPEKESTFSVLSVNPARINYQLVSTAFSKTEQNNNVSQRNPCLIDYNPYRISIIPRYSFRPLCSRE
jgi:hypothetical protein